MLTEADHAMLRAPNFAHLATIREDGTPQVSVVWIDTDGDHVRVNSARGRVKDRNIARDRRVAVSVHRQDDPYVTVSIDGIVDEEVSGPEADAHIDALSRAYTGRPWTPSPDETRVLWRIRPTRVVRHR